MLHLVFLTVLQIIGYGLIIYYCGWQPALGLFLLFWQNNVSQTVEKKINAELAAVKFGR